MLDSLHDDEATAAAVLDARVATFDHRMNVLLGQLDQADRRITDLQ